MRNDIFATFIAFLGLNIQVSFRHLTDSPNQIQLTFRSFKTVRVIHVLLCKLHGAPRFVTDINLKVITDAGFGADYKVPGLPHRTGHGIGLDGHEWTNFVRGNKTKLQEQGPKLFSAQSVSIDQPFG